MAVYFVQCGGNGGRIKIGYALDVRSRLSQIAIGAPFPLLVLGVIADGSLQDERALHRKFRHLRRYREWFDPGPELLALCAEHRAADVTKPISQHTEHVRQVMQALGCPTQSELADLLMMKKSAVSNWLRTGISVRGLRRAQTVANERGVTLPPVPAEPGFRKSA